MIVAISLWIVAILIAGIVASGKGRSPIGWCLLVLIFPISILILLVLGPRPAIASDVNFGEDGAA